MYRFLPLKLGEISNSLVRSATRTYKRAHGVSGMEWAVMAVLCEQPDITANQICRQLGLDKGAASRAVARLTKLQLVVLSDHQVRGRQRFLTLTPTGKALHQRLMVIAQERERLLTARLSPGEMDLLLDLLARLSMQLDAVNRYVPSASET